MPFDSQFQLGLELTKFIPLDLLGSKAAEAIIDLAKRLQNSGSDLLVEHDLAAVFGRCRISQQLESSFKTLVARSTEPTPLFESIMLSSGPGPTVARALKSPPFFSMVVQLSFLHWIHEKAALAQAIAQSLEKRTYGAPPDHTLQALPSQESIAGVLTACEEQTNAFDWDGILLAIAATLGYYETDACDAISPVVLRGAMDMFPSVQQLHEDRLVHIQTGDGICAIVAWAHNILDLNVLVKAEDGTETRFGKGHEQVLLETSNLYYDNTISLLDAAGDVLFRIEHEVDDFQIDSAPRTSLRGYGKKYLASMSLNPAMEEEFTLVVTALSIHVARLLVAYNANEEPKGSAETSYGLTAQHVAAAAKVVFDRKEIRQAQLDVYCQAYGGSQAIADCPAPNSIRTYCRVEGKSERTQQQWEDTTVRLIPMIVALVAVAHIQPLDGADNLPLTAVRVLEEHPLSNILKHWQGRTPIAVQDDMFFNAIAMLLGLRVDASPYLDTVSLLSNRGWSVYFDVFGNADPVHADPISLRVTKGVPVRNGIQKHGIIDGPRSGMRVFGGGLTQW